MAFASTWSALQSKLTAQTVVSNWTALKGRFGDAFTVVEVGPDLIAIRAPKAKHLQRVGKADVEAVYSMWPAYLAGKVQRVDLRERTRFSKYVISILHWLEDEIGGPLP